VPLQFYLKQNGSLLVLFFLGIILLLTSPNLWCEVNGFFGIILHRMESKKAKALSTRERKIME